MQRKRPASTSRSARRERAAKCRSPCRRRTGREADPWASQLGPTCLEPTENAIHGQQKSNDLHQNSHDFVTFEATDNNEGKAAGAQGDRSDRCLKQRPQQTNSLAHRHFELDCAVGPEDDSAKTATSTEIRARSVASHTSHPHGYKAPVG